jgi:hypothetical protein
MLSTTVSVDWAETGFRICSLFMGAFTVLMVVTAVFYAFDGENNLLAVIFMVVFLASYAVPLIVNIHNLKLADFLKGVVYSIYMSPTYVNIFTIFAISNIHDVSWGSRPATQDTRVKAAADKKDEMYKDFRANFLIFWLAVNIVVGGWVTYASRNDQEYILLGIGIFLAAVLVIKLVLALLYIVLYLIHKVAILIRSRNLQKSQRFNRVRTKDRGNS